mgnify:FL=1|tara:strand:- start:73 stop:576 length:504 start_codon:yes stop_codon:yes gene_type:complete
MIHTLLSKIGIETWKNVPNFQGLYQVSNLGRIRNINYRGTNKTKYLKSNTKRKSVCLYKNKISKKTSIAVWMAITFLNFKPNRYSIVVDHIDNDVTNDCLYNLQIISHRENISKDIKNKVGYTGVRKNGKKWNAKIDINYKRIYLGTFETPQEAAQAYQKELKKINL